jgi:hypothetical protein
MVLSGIIADTVQVIYAGQSLAHLLNRLALCGAECSMQG